MYIVFISQKFSILNSYEFILLIFLFVLFLSLFISLILFITSTNRLKIEKNKLLKTEKLLINLKGLFKNGQINAKEYKERIISLTKNENI